MKKEYMKPEMEVVEIEISPIANTPSDNYTIINGGSNNSWDNGIVEDFWG